VNRGSWIALWVLSLGWGTVGVATRSAFQRGVDPLTVVSGRLVIAACLVVLAQVVLRRRIRIERPVLRTGAVMAVTGIAMPFLLFNIAYQHASAGFVGLMAALSPLGTAAFAHVLLPDEPLTRQRLIGLVLGIAGVAILLLSGDSGLAIGGDGVRAVAWSLPGIAAFSFSTVYAKRQSASLAGFDVMVIQFTIAAVLMVIPMLVFEGPPRLDGVSWALLIYLAVGSTVVPLMLFYWVLERNSAGQAALVGFLVPVVAVVAGVILLGERAGPGLVAGGLAIICGVLIADRGGCTGRRPA